MLSPKGIRSKKFQEIHSYAISRREKKITALFSFAKKKERKEGIRGYII